LIVSEFDVVLVLDKAPNRSKRTGFYAVKKGDFGISRSGFKSSSALIDWFISSKFLLKLYIC
jgi:hypothetical protein